MVNRRIIAGAPVFAVALALTAHGALAHAFLDHASPAVGSSVPSPPAAVKMWFTQQLEPAFTTATVTDQSGNSVDSAVARVDPQDPTELQVPLKPLPPGTYTVAWHALSVDTHTTQGHFTFAVGGR
ncbi:MAG TPA: copper resistance CopC family protein [Stellaceae bacterium]|jgi:methionine-rich copper-binding protein CopC|nr:copper resistance CopC family protein [Stellaceae bacterium]